MDTRIVELQVIIEALDEAQAKTLLTLIIATHPRPQRIIQLLMELIAEGEE